MKRYHIWMAAEGAALFAGAMTTALLLQEVWPFALGLFIWLNLYAMLNHQRKVHEKEFAAAAAAIDRIIDGSRQQESLPYTDMMLDRIRHSLNGLQEMADKYEERIKNDRDQTRELITEIAHQLRIPLANIESYIEILQSESLSPEIRDQCVKAVYESEEKLKFLVESFIKMSRFDNKVIQIRKESSDLNATILKAVLQVQKRAEERQITISMDKQCKDKVWHDSNWFGEAIYNLLDNSVKYAEEQTEVGIHIVQNDMFTQIEIRDTGKGIEKGEENLIFSRFYRGANVTTQEGFGIGLYLAREIVTRHDGFMKAKRLPAGLSMSIYLPF